MVEAVLREILGVREVQEQTEYLALMLGRLKAARLSPGVITEDREAFLILAGMIRIAVVLVRAQEGLRAVARMDLLRALSDRMARLE